MLMLVPDKPMDYFRADTVDGLAVRLSRSRVPYLVHRLIHFVRAVLRSPRPLSSSLICVTSVLLIVLFRDDNNHFGLTERDPPTGVFIYVVHP